MKITLHHIIAATLLCVIPAVLSAQQPQQASMPATQTAKPLPLPAVGYENRLGHRSEFSSHATRANSDSGDRRTDWSYQYVTDYTTTDSDGVKTYSATVDIPDYWADRLVIMHTNGGRNSHTVSVNGTIIGSSRDSGTPSEFDLTKHLRRGANTITVEVPCDTTEPESGLTTKRPDITTWFLYSPPRTRIVDYSISALVTGADGEGELLVDVIVENGYRGDEKFTVGFDIFSPAGRLEEYGMKDITMTGLSRDTMRFKATLYGAGKHTWSASQPDIYKLTLFVSKSGRMLEYVPVNVGFGRTEYSDGAISRNGKKITIKQTSYNASTPEKLRKDIAAFRKQGINTIIPDYPQPYWFYDICDRTGMYVIDQANINSSHQPDNLRIGGTPSNDPAWLPEYMERTQAMYYRSHNHPCIIAWSLGGDSGNGYNMYRTYLWLKQTDPARAVVYRGVRGSWNNDIAL